MNDARPVRIVAALTTAYSLSITIAPRLLAKPARLTGPGGEVPTPVAELIRSIGTRDASLAAVLAVAPVGYPITLLTAARVVSDAADAVWFARMVPSGQRAKIAAVAAGWATLELAAALWSNRSR